MSHRATISLEDEAFAFLNRVGGKNKSAYINALLKRERQRTLEAAVLRANREEAADAGYQDALSVWDETLLDGLDG